MRPGRAQVVFHVKHPERPPPERPPPHAHARPTIISELVPDHVDPNAESRQPRQAGAGGGREGDPHPPTPPPAPKGPPSPPSSQRPGDASDELAVAGERLHTLSLDHGLAPEVESGLLKLLSFLQSAGARAPTTVTAPASAVEVHIADSLASLAVDAVRGARRVADLGAGAGFPGLVLAAALLEAEVWLVESQESKCGFIAAAIGAIELSNAHVVRARAEEWREGLGAHDLVTARALAAQPVVLEYAAPLLRLGGHVVDWRGARRPQEEERALAAAGELGLRRVEVLRVEPHAEATEHHLHLFEKVGETPSSYPRRPGAAARKPLGGARGAG